MTVKELIKVNIEFWGENQKTLLLILSVEIPNKDLFIVFPVYIKTL